MDVRFLPNPHWEDDLRPLTGHDPQVRDYVLETAAGSGFVERFDELLASLLPQYEAEGRSYLTVAIGCTGGRHRSVAVAEELAERLRGHGVAVRTTPPRRRPLTTRSAHRGRVRNEPWRRGAS